MVCANSKMYYCRLIADCFQEMYSFKFKLLKTLSYFACHLEKPSRCSLIKMQLINHLFPFWLGDRIIPWRHTIKLETDCKTKSLKPSIWAFVYLHLENVMNESKNVGCKFQFCFKHVSRYLVNIYSILFTVFFQVGFAKWFSRRTSFTFCILFIVFQHFLYRLH